MKSKGQYWVLLTLGLCLTFPFLSVFADDEIPSGTFYVSPAGNDSDSGDFDHPFATIGRAKTAVAGLVAAGLTNDVVVYLRGGTYLLNDTLTFGPTDSGTSTHSITYKAYPGETPKVVGGRRLQPDWFTAVTNPGIISRLPAGMDTHVLVADLSAHGYTASDYGTLNLRGFPWDYVPSAMELFVGGQVMQLGRWPNTGWQNIAGIPNGKYGKQFTYSGTQPDRWTTASDGWVWGDFTVYWADAFIPISGIDTATKTISLTDEGYDGIAYTYSYYTFTPIWYGLNLLEEIDTPGEWYLDRSTGKLYLYPPSDLTGQDIFVSMINTLITCQSASNLNFEGLILEVNRSWTATVDNGCNHVRFYQCTFRNGGTFAARIYGTYNGLEGCHIQNMGDGGVALHGGVNQDRGVLTWANNYLLNSHIHHLNRWGKTAKPGSWSDSDCGMTISHNLIHDLPAIAIDFTRCNEMTITYNDIYNVCNLVEDNGAMYCEFDWTCRGSDIKYNFIHNNVSAFMPVSGVGIPCIYFDFAGSGAHVESNIFYQNTFGRGVFIGGGRDITIINNIFANCYAGIFIDRRLNDTLYYSDYYANTISQLWNFLVRNTNYKTYGPDYVGLKDILTDSPQEPMHNQVKRNLATGYTASWTQSGSLGGTSPSAVSFLEQQDNVTGKTLDPKFVDAANLNMNLQPSSPAYTIPGWVDIPFDQIGLSPAAPVIYLAADSTNYVVSGQVEPWAIIHSAVIRETGQNIASLLTVSDNGAVSGVIPRSSIAGNVVTVELAVKDPKNHISPTGDSNTITNADLSGNGTIDTADLGILAAQWLETCTSPGWCSGTDFNHDGVVNLYDFNVLMAHWLEAAP